MSALARETDNTFMAKDTVVPSCNMDGGADAWYARQYSREHRVYGL